MTTPTITTGSVRISTHRIQSRCQGRLGTPTRMRSSCWTTAAGGTALAVSSGSYYVAKKSPSRGETGASSDGVTP